MEIRMPKKRTLFASGLLFISVFFLVISANDKVAFALIHVTSTFTTVLAPGAHGGLAWTGGVLALTTEAYASSPTSLAWVCAGYSDSSGVHCKSNIYWKPAYGTSFNSGPADINSYYRNDEQTTQTLTNIDAGTYN